MKKLLLLITLAFISASTAHAGEGWLAGQQKNAAFLLENCEEWIDKEDFLESYCAASFVGYINGYGYGIHAIPAFSQDDPCAVEKGQLIADFQNRICAEKINDLESVVKDYLSYMDKAQHRYIESRKDENMSFKDVPAGLSMTSFFFHQYPDCREK